MMNLLLAPRLKSIFDWEITPAGSRCWSCASTSLHIIPYSFKLTPLPMFYSIFFVLVSINSFPIHLKMGCGQRSRKREIREKESEQRKLLRLAFVGCFCGNGRNIWYKHDISCTIHHIFHFSFANKNNNNNTTNKKVDLNVSAYIFCSWILLENNNCCSVCSSKLLFFPLSSWATSII